MNRELQYELTLTWTGNTGSGTSGVRDFSRSHAVEVPGKPTLHMSADIPFRGDADRWNPEELLLAALSGCHMLSYLWLAAQNGVVVAAYTDHPSATLTLHRDGGGEMESATLQPAVTVLDERHRELALNMHEEAARLCFIARSVNFPVRHQPSVTVAPA